MCIIFSRICIIFSHMGIFQSQWSVFFVLWCYGLIPSVVFTNSSAMQLIFCLWCIIQPLPSVILNLSPHPYNLLCHSYNSVSDVQNSFCDPHNFFCHPQVYANELPAFLMMSSVFVVELVSNDRFRIHFDYFFTHTHLSPSVAIG